MRKELTIDIISAAILLLFLYTGVSKLLNYSDLRFALTQSPLLAPFSKIAAWLLPASEIAIALLLFFPVTRTVGLYISLALLSILTAYLIYMVINTADLPCNCGGVITFLSWKQHILFNSFFILLTAFAIWLIRKRRKLPGAAPT